MVSSRSRCGLALLSTVALALGGSAAQAQAPGKGRLAQPAVWQQPTTWQQFAWQQYLWQQYAMQQVQQQNALLYPVQQIQQQNALLYSVQQLQQQNAVLFGLLQQQVTLQQVQQMQLQAPPGGQQPPNPFALPK